MLTKENHVQEKIRNAFGEVKAIGYKTKSFNSNIAKSEGKKVMVYQTEKVDFSCLRELMGSDGLFGLNTFSKAENPKPLLLDYEHSVLKVLKQNTETPDGYTKMNAFFKNGHVFLKATVNGQQRNLLFDTGSNLFVVLKDKIFKDFTNKGNSHNIKTTTIAANNSVVPTKMMFIENVKLTVGGMQIKNPLIAISEEMVYNTAGLSFIENYNWIIDFENEKVFAKKIGTFDSNNFFEFIGSIENLVIAVNNKLLVIYSKKEYSVGDIITSINGKDVTAENVCDFQKMLNEKRKDWSGMDIKTISLGINFDKE